MMSWLGVLEWPYALLGAVVGLLVGMTGVGGGSLMTPLLILLFGIIPTAAVGTDLIFAAATKSVGTFVNGFNHAVNWSVVGLLAAGSLPASAITLFILSKTDLHSPAVNDALRDILVVALLLSAASLLARRQIERLLQNRSGAPLSRPRALTILTGAVVGVLVSLTSTGAGAIGIIGLLLLYPKIPMARIVASDVAHAVPLTLLAGVGHAIMNSVHWGILTSLLTGSIPAIVLGSYLGARMPERLLQIVLAATLIVVALQTMR